jgi:membrane protein involved in colicin uptake
MTQTKLIVDAALGTEEIVELTAEEVAEIKANEAAYAKAKADEEQAAAEKAEAKASIADRLGLTQDELALLLA